MRYRLVPWMNFGISGLPQWVCQLTFNQKLGFSTPPYNLYGEAKKVLALCVAVLTVQLSTDFGTSEIHCLENQVLNSTKYNVSKSVLLSTDFTCLLWWTHFELSHRSLHPNPRSMPKKVQKIAPRLLCPP